MSTVALAPAFDPAGSVIDAAAIPPTTQVEASSLATAILERFLAVVGSLSADEWNLPTYCSEWSVRDLVAHQAGAYASGASFAVFRDQWSRRPEPGGSMLDTVNRFQIQERAEQTTDELIAELRDVGPRAIAARRHLSSLIRNLPIPIPPLGWRRVAYLTDELYPRDTWIHTVDVCHATSRPLLLDPQLDRRVVALILRDLANRLAKGLAGHAIAFNLSGPAGSCYRIGPAVAPAATISMETIDFNLRASGRIEAEQALGRSRILGDRDLARQVLEQTLVVY